MGKSEWFGIGAFFGAVLTSVVLIVEDPTREGMVLIASGQYTAELVKNKDGTTRWEFKPASQPPAQQERSE